MTSTAPEAVRAFDYTVLDEYGDEIAALVVAYWYLRPTMSEDAWIETIVDVLSAFLVQAEYGGRLFGREAEVAVAGDLALPPLPTTPYRPVPEDFVQRSGLAPTVTDLDMVRRRDEVAESVRKAVGTLAADIPRPAEREEARGQNLDRVERFAKDETVAQMQRGYQDGARESGKRGYRRGLNPDACELCFWLWKEGYVYPIDQPMHRHVGCRCWPIFTTDSVGRYEVAGTDEVGRNLLDRYYSETLRETSFRRPTE